MTAANQGKSQEGLDTRPPQFGLRTLFWVVTGLCALFSVMALVGWMWSTMLLMLVLLIGGHVLGNALGTSMRNQASGSYPAPRPIENVARPVHSTTGLQQKQPMSRLFLLVGLVGAGIGAVLGGACVAWHDWQHITLSALIFGTLACAVLGGLFSFLVSCGLRITLLAWREMWHHHKSQT